MCGGLKDIKRGRNPRNHENSGTDVEPHHHEAWRLHCTPSQVDFMIYLCIVSNWVKSGAFLSTWTAESISFEKKPLVWTCHIICWRMSLWAVFGFLRFVWVSQGLFLFWRVGPIDARYLHSMHAVKHSQSRLDIFYAQEFAQYYLFVCSKIFNKYLPI